MNESVEVVDLKDVGNLLDHLAREKSRLDRANDRLHVTVAAARERGATWEQIGGAIGVDLGRFSPLGGS